MLITILSPFLDDLATFVEFLEVVEHHGSQCFWITCLLVSFVKLWRIYNSTSCQGNPMIVLKRSWQIHLFSSVLTQISQCHGNSHDISSKRPDIDSQFWHLPVSHVFLVSYSFSLSQFPHL